MKRSHIHSGEKHLLSENVHNITRNIFQFYTHIPIISQNLIDNMLYIKWMHLAWINSVQAKHMDKLTLISIKLQILFLLIKPYQSMFIPSWTIGSVTCLTQWSNVPEMKVRSQRLCNILWVQIPSSKNCISSRQYNSCWVDACTLILHHSDTSNNVLPNPSPHITLSEHLNIDIQ